jgi:hypothetical protein
MFFSALIAPAKDQAMPGRVRPQLQRRAVHEQAESK